MLGLTNYYQHHIEVLELLRNLLEGRSRISLRALDHFITTYSRDNQVILYLDPRGRLLEHGGEGEKLTRMNVHSTYRSQLQAYGKAMFDPFRRRDRISFAPVTGVTPISTTVGQLNCVRWLHSSGIIQYVEAHIGHIEASMKAASAPAPTPAQQEGPEPATAAPKKAAAPPPAPIRGMQRLSFN